MAIMNTLRRMPQNPWLLRTFVTCMFVMLPLISISMLAKGTGDAGSIRQTPSLTSTCISGGKEGNQQWIPPQVLGALIKYATSRVIPQQKRREIEVSMKVLAARSPSNFLVFGLGHDSTLWNALNFRGKTVFLEEDSNWIRKILNTYPYSAPKLRAYHVKYPTKLSQADDLLSHSRSDSSCGPTQPLKASKCKLALSGLPREIYETEWDVIMIDAPRGYFDAAPGRMTAIFSAAVMANGRKKRSATDVFLHDVNRRVEKMYAQEFLCKRNLVGSVGRLWHFRIPPFNASATPKNSRTLFCP